jgi:glyoxylase-like metal-dependent hydrolase (beta-lactamase superfamily II)
MGTDRFGPRADAPPDPHPDPPAPPPIEHLPDGTLAIDTLTGGMRSVTAGYLLPAPRPTLIECGPALAVDHVIAGLHSLGFEPDDLAYLVVTHVHLDHAGGAGAVAAAFSHARVVVSELGARHLHDPERLNRSARQVYGPLFDTVYGACRPTEQQRILGVADGHELDLGGGRRLELLATPGHAKHHLGVHDLDTGAIFAGDSVGVKLPGMTVIRPATPPADFHLGAALESLRRYRERDPSRLYLAHYGAVDPPDAALAQAEERLRLWAATAEAAYHEQDELDHVAATLARRFADELRVEEHTADPDAERRLALLSDVRSNAAGLLRYLRRRDEGTLTPLG